MRISNFTVDPFLDELNVLSSWNFDRLFLGVQPGVGVGTSTIKRRPVNWITFYLPTGRHDGTGSRIADGKISVVVNFEYGEDKLIHCRALHDA